MAENARQPIIATWSTWITEPGEFYNRPGPVGPGFHRGTVAAGTIIPKPPQRVAPLSGSGQPNCPKATGVLSANVTSVHWTLHGATTVRSPGWVGA